MEKLKVKDFTSILEKEAPPSYQESYDNSGLITGNSEQEVSGVLICLDSTESVIDEAISKKCNFIIAHHPIVFSGLKKITGKNYVERTIIKAIKNDIAIYAIHTNLDNVAVGVNQKICEKLGVENCKILSPKSALLRKLVTFCPVDQADKVRQALFEAGAGQIGNYSECSFNLEGTGTFKASRGTNPYVGEIDKQHKEKETRIETIYETVNEPHILKALFNSHPYEEVAYDLYSLSNTYNEVGSGMIGSLKESVSEIDFLSRVKTAFQTGSIRHTELRGKPVKKVAVCGGSGSFLLSDAVRAGADLFLTSDFKYHQFFDADGRIVIADIGHYESEQYTKDLIFDILIKKFPTFALRLSEVVTNPVKYF